MASHLLALEDLARLLTLTCRTVRTMRDRYAVRGTQATKIMALHRTGKTLTLGGADDIDLLAGDKVARRDGRANLEDCIITDTELGELRLRHHIRLGEMAAHGLRYVLGLGRTCTELDSRVAVTLLLADRNHLNVIHLQNRHRNVQTGVGKDPRHPQLAGDNSATHCFRPFPRA